MPEDLVWNAIPKSSWGTSSALQYQEMRQVGKGTYGEVFLGMNMLNRETVALKKVSWSHSEAKHRHRGFPLNAIREIRLLKNKCSHPNLVSYLMLLHLCLRCPTVKKNEPSSLDQKMRCHRVTKRMIGKKKQKAGMDLSILFLNMLNMT